MTRRSFKLLAILLLGISSGLLLATPIWERLEPAPWAGGHGEAIVGAGELVCLAHQLYANDIPEFACYDTQQERWIVHFEVPGLNLRNGTALAWDGHFIYILIGAREGDEDRKGFYRLNLGTQQLEQLEPTPHAQGAGDAIVYSGYDGKIYAFISRCEDGHGDSIFARYDPEKDHWDPKLPMPEGWEGTDDGASLVWTGDEYIYAFQGECEETNPTGRFARFHIPTGRWEELAELEATKYWDEEDPSSLCGVGDGGTLVWAPETPNYIYATDGVAQPGQNLGKRIRVGAFGVTP